MSFGMIISNHNICKKAKLCYMDTGSFVVYIRTDDLYKDIAEDVETRFVFSICELDRPLPKGKNKKVTGLIKDELGGKIMKKFVGLRAKTFSYLIDNGSEGKRAKSTKKCIIKIKFKSKDYKNCLKATQLENKINQLEKNKFNTEILRENHNEFIKNKN